MISPASIKYSFFPAGVDASLADWMPDKILIVAEAEPLPPVALIPFTCPWAQDGLRRAIEGMGHATTGVNEYHIGTRGLKYVDPAKQIGSVGWWNEMVKYFCGIDALPNSVTGRDTACRIIPRDV